MQASCGRAIAALASLRCTTALPQCQSHPEDGLGRGSLPSDGALAAPALEDEVTIGQGMRVLNYSLQDARAAYCRESSIVPETV